MLLNLCRWRSRSVNDRCWRRQNRDPVSRNLYYLDRFSDVLANFDANCLGHWNGWLYLNGWGRAVLLSHGTTEEHGHSN